MVFSGEVKQVAKFYKCSASSVHKRIIKLFGDTDSDRG